MNDDMDADLGNIANSVRLIADAITPIGAMRGTDAMGGSVGSLTEAVCGITAGLAAVAEAMNNIADAIRDHAEATR